MARCKYGKLKRPKGRRVCRLRRAPRRRRYATREDVKYERDLERDLIARYKAGLGRLRRRRRR